MIPTTNNKLLVSEDWKKIYQSFQNADFKSYDFDTLRRTMINYLQENYPEDFNDFIESSEYIALIDVIAYLGQNLSFRIDLNARENFLETAQRRDSILRLAQLISYVPKRNITSSGLLKITGIATSDNVIDANGTNLVNTTIGWNDPTNSNWYQQFVSIFNSSISGTGAFGKPADRKTIDGILTEQYKINSSNTDVPVYSFSKNINGTGMNFEIVSSTFSGTTTIREEAPRPGNTIGLIYKNDNQGASSTNTGFFMQFRQGTLGVANFPVSNPVPNEIVGVNTPGINDTDVWLWQLSTGQAQATLWTKVSDIVGNNIIYNSLNKDERDIYSVTSRDNDQIDLNFADGSFGNLPKGQFNLFYRQSNGLTYTIKPEQMRGILIEIPYKNKVGQQHTLSLTMGLQYTVNNSSGPESNASIQSKAPQNYYIQNRMVTAEDYNIAPLTSSSDILKVKSVNRVSSGISKYFDLSDVSGKYSKTNIFATDGIIYQSISEQNFQFSFANRNEIFAAIKQQLSPIISSTAMRSFYFAKYNKLTFSDNALQYIKVGAMIKFLPPAGKYFSAKGKIVSKATATTLNYMWATVINTSIGSLFSSNDISIGPITLSNAIDIAAIPSEIIPKFVNIFSYAFENELVNLSLNQINFGLSFNSITRSWNIILNSNLDINPTHPFSLEFQGNKDNSSRDASWLVAFVWNGKGYKVKYRILDYIFESAKETAFFIDSNSVNYDFVSDTVVKDQIDILSINPLPTIASAGLSKDYMWQIDSAVTESDGYVDPKKVKVSFYDYNNLGQISDPDSFTNIVDPKNENFVYFKKLADGIRYNLADESLFVATKNPSTVIGLPSDGDLYYFYDNDYNVVKSYVAATNTWVYQPAYFAYPGRSNLKFQYTHNSSEDRRIDPSKSNIIDIYLLTAGYDTAYRNWLINSVGNAPLAPTSQGLEQNYAASLETIKTISDEMIFQPVKYKVLFGTNADINLQATFKAVKNPSRTVSDNEIKTRILNAMQQFFSLENWTFGQSFYFSELSTYVMNLLTPDITNFVIVPTANNNFGSLYEIGCLSNEIFINGARISDIEVIDAITASQLNTTSIVTSSGT